jgi:hypothetical protein
MRSLIGQPYEYIKAKPGGTCYPEYPDQLANYRWVNPTADDELEIFIVEPAVISGDGDFILADEILVRSAGTISIDFGCEFAGWLEVDIPDLKGKITLGISEYNEPAVVNEGPESPLKMKEPVRYGNTYRLELNEELYEGVRFGFIHIAEYEGPFTISKVRLVCQTKPVNYNGSFCCDNALLNRVWYCGAYGIRTNLKKDYFSAILMDRGDRFSWTGDAHPAQDGALTAFGNYDFIYHNLVFTSTRGNGIPVYELYWIFSTINYYRYTGDYKGIEKLARSILTRLDEAIENCGREIDLKFFGWDERLGSGFENVNTAANRNSYKFLAIRAINACTNYFSGLIPPGYSRIADQWIKELDFSDLTLHSACDAINAGLLPDEMIEGIYERYLTDRVNRLSYSPFNEYFILQAMARINRHADATDCILDMFGGQVEYGGTTFFETYRPCWNDELGRLDAPVNNQAGYTSLNHPWGCGVIHFMNEEILGIKPKTPGFREFDIFPHPGGRLEYLKGETPTPFGTIFAEFDPLNGVCRIKIPAGTVGTISIPKFGKEVSADFHFKSQDKDYIHLEPLGEGEYEFRLIYRGSVEKYCQKEYSYRAEYLGENIRASYGRNGFYLNKLNCSLPDFVEKIVPNKEVLRERGVLTTNDYIACFQTFTMDIYLRKACMVTLHFVDDDRQGRRQAVEMFDLETLELIAPLKVIRDFSEGKYLSFYYNKPLRFRINQIRGVNAVLNGIYFDLQ